jgi:hypothetical protein
MSYRVRTPRDVYLWSNRMLVTSDEWGEQIPDLQGPHTPELEAEIRQRADDRTAWHGFVGPPCEWLPGRRDWPAAP